MVSSPHQGLPPALLRANGITARDHKVTVNQYSQICTRKSLCTGELRSVQGLLLMDLIHKRLCLATVVQIPVLTEYQCYGEQNYQAVCAGDDVHMPLIATIHPLSSSLQFSLYVHSQTVKLKGVGGNTPSVVAVEGISG